jgi:amino acid transporter
MALLVQIMLLRLAFGWIIVFLAAYVLKQNALTGSASGGSNSGVPNWSLVGLIIIGALMAIVSFFGFAASYSHRPRLLRIYVTVVLIIVAATAVMAVASAVLGVSINDAVDANCNRRAISSSLLGSVC